MGTTVGSLRGAEFAATERFARRSGPARRAPALGAALVPVALPSRRPEVFRGLDALMHGVVGRIARFRFSPGRFLTAADRVLRLESEFARRTDEQLLQDAAQLRGVFRRSMPSRGEIERGLALAREAAARELGQRAFAVQVAGALAIHEGCVAEMATGEGKTLTAALAAVLSGWRGRGCHIVTANDYLASRDQEWMSRVFTRLNLTSSVVVQDSATDSRRAAYRCDITYCTNKEVAADYLRDRLFAATGRPPLLRETSPLDRAIIDEADFVLIDDAVTPLILSGDEPNAERAGSYEAARGLADLLVAGRHYRVDLRHRDVTLTTEGSKLIGETTAGWGGVWSGRRRREELAVLAIEAREFFVRGREYVIQDRKIVIVDEATGRLMPDRSWREGVHQAVEAKERLEISPTKSVHARVSFQRLFRGYKTIAGMTGTAADARAELWNIYNLPVVRLPTNRPSIRRVLPARVVRTEHEKWLMAAIEAESASSAGRPVLLGTRSVGESEALSAALTARGVRHDVLNAVHQEHEARVVADAGQPGRVTVATNMAGRGTDILLSDASRAAGGLLVIATARHESRRIDRQLAGRAARQGDPGSSITLLSIDDELIRKHAGRPGINLARAWAGPVFRWSQWRAERLARYRRRQLLLHDDWLDDFLGFAGAE